MAYISQIKLSDTTYDISAIKLKNARKINLTGAVTGSVSFDGSSDVSIATTTNHNHDSSYLKYSGWWNSSSGQNVNDASGMVFAYGNHGLPGSWGIVTTFDYYKGSAYRHQIYGDGWNNEMYFRTCSSDRKGWNGWRHLLDDSNYTSYTVTKSGSGASGTWPISITGNAASASSVAWSNVSGKPSTFAPSSHTHSYLPLSGGTMTGAITHGGENGTTASDSIGAALLCGYGGNTGIFHGNGDSGVESLGTSATANLIIKSWYGVGFADGCTGNGITVGINCRTGRVTAKSVYGAVWNDYAEFRICNEDFKPGQVVLENGDDTLSIASQRLQRGCSIVSDTFGFAIGETDEAKCPIAVSGRVLAYGYESREEFKNHIGWPVCSGPNGTVSIMTEEEEEKYPSRIIGTISAVPDYETWGTGNVEVNNRIWIKVK